MLVTMIVAMHPTQASTMIMTMTLIPVAEGRVSNIGTMVCSVFAKAPNTDGNPHPATLTLTAPVTLALLCRPQYQDCGRAVSRGVRACLMCLRG